MQRIRTIYGRPHDTYLKSVPRYCLYHVEVAFSRTQMRGTYMVRRWKYFILNHIHQEERRRRSGREIFASFGWIGLQPASAAHGETHHSRIT